MPSFEEWLKIFGPTWLQDAGGKAVLGAMGQQADGAIDLATQAVQARFLSRAPSDALAKIGAERRISRAPWETEADYRATLVRAWEAWGGDPVLGGGAGTPAGILTAAARSGVPFRYATDPAGSPDATTYVQWNGRWVQLYSDGRTPIFGVLDQCRTRGYSGPTSFIPTGLGSTLKLWLRGNDGLVASGGNVSSIADQSGNGNSVTAAGTVGYSSASINGLPGWTFTGGGNLRNLTQGPLASGSARTIFVVARAAGEAGGPVFESFRSSGQRATYFQGGTQYIGSGFVYTDSAGRFATTAVSTISGVPVVLEYAAPATPSFVAIRINGTPLVVTQGNACTAETGSAGFSVGQWELIASGYVGDIDEVIVCNTVLSTQQADAVRAYLSQRYNIPIVSTPNAFSSGWFDGDSLPSKSYLLFPTPGGVVAGLDNTSGNQLKSILNATVRLWKRASETYGGAWVFNSQGPDYVDAPEGSDEWFMNQEAGGGGCLGWPPSSMDPTQILGDGYVLAGDPSTFIAPT